MSPDKSWERGDIRLSTALKADCPGAWVATNNASKSNLLNVVTASAMVFGNLGFSSGPPSTVMITMGLTSPVAVHIASLNSGNAATTSKSLACDLAEVESCLPERIATNVGPEYDTLSLFTMQAAYTDGINLCWPAMTQ